MVQSAAWARSEGLWVPRPRTRRRRCENGSRL